MSNENGSNNLLHFFEIYQLQFGAINVLKILIFEH